MNEYMNTPKVSGDEKDGLGKIKNNFRWRSGVRKNIKKQYNKRNRKHVKEIIREEY